GVLPRVGHRDDVVVVQVAPLAVAPVQTAGGWSRAGGGALPPPGPLVVGELLRPQHSRPGPAPDPRPFPRDPPRRLELIGLLGPGHHRPLPRGPEVLALLAVAIGQAKPDLASLARGDGQAIPERGLRSGLIGVDRRQAVDDVVVDAVLRIGRLAPHAP